MNVIVVTTMHKLKRTNLFGNKVCIYLSKITADTVYINQSFNAATVFLPNNPDIGWIWNFVIVSEGGNPG